MDQLADNAGRGLRVLGLSPGDKVALYAETRSEWFVTAQACFKQNFPVVTLYTNLREDAVTHGVNETEVGESTSFLGIGNIYILNGFHWRSHFRSARL